MHVSFEIRFLGLLSARIDAPLASPLAVLGSTGSRTTMVVIIKHYIYSNIYIYDNSDRDAKNTLDT